MSGKNTALFGIYPTHESADAAVALLRSKGFRSSDVGIMAMPGALVRLGMPEYQAKRYEGRMRTGGILLSVHADDREWTSKGKQILEHSGAEDISSDQ